MTAGDRSLIGERRELGNRVNLLVDLARIRTARPLNWFPSPTLSHLSYRPIIRSDYDMRTCQSRSAGTGTPNFLLRLILLLGAMGVRQVGPLVWPDTCIAKASVVVAC